MSNPNHLLSLTVCLWMSFLPCFSLPTSGFPSQIMAPALCLLSAEIASPPITHPSILVANSISVTQSLVVLQWKSSLYTVIGRALAQSSNNHYANTLSLKMLLNVIDLRGALKSFYWKGKWGNCHFFSDVTVCMFISGWVWWRIQRAKSRSHGAVCKVTLSNINNKLGSLACHRRNKNGDSIFIVLIFLSTTSDKRNYNTYNMCWIYNVFIVLSKLRDVAG